MKALLTITLLLVGTTSFSQQTVYDTIVHDGIQRSFILYIPASYSAGTAAPLVMNFHGYTSNASEQMFYGDFRPIADTAGFLVVHPMGTLDGSNEPYWNSDWGGTVDDIGFTSALIDSLAAQYSVNLDRVYSTGMSNGGFMSYTLACSLSNRIAAIASVTGAMNAFQSSSCNPQHPMPIMEIHGTSDPVVPYAGNASMASAVSTVNYWASVSACDATPIETAVPNTVIGDNCTATHFLYPNGNNGVEIEHYRINAGAHTWPGAPIVVGTTNYDIDASEKIWEFFAKYDLNGRILETPEQELANLSLYPNPAHSVVNINGFNDIQLNRISIYSALGQRMADISSPEAQFSVEGLDSGVYFVHLTTDSGERVIRMVVG